MEFAELTGKQKLVFEACVKIQLGEKFIQEGTIELKALMGDGAKKASPHKKDESTFRHDKRSDETIMASIVSVLRTNRQASTQLLKHKLHVSDRRLERILTRMTKEKTIEDMGTQGRHAWVLWSKSAPSSKPAVVAHKKVSRRGSAIDHTNPDLANKMLNFLRTHDWVSKRKMIAAVDMSPGPLNRLLSHLEKTKQIKIVRKKFNPAHKDIPKVYHQELPYWEVV